MRTELSSAWRILLVVITVFTQIQRSNQKSSRSDDTKLLDNLLRSYDPRMRPSGSNSTDGPVEITVNAMVLPFVTVSDFDMEYGLHMFFRQEWVDERLNYKLYRSNESQYLTITDASKIWMPDLFISNEKDAQLHDLLDKNSFIRVFPSGNILYSVRISLTLWCYIHLKHFPFDKQDCIMKIGSYGHDTSDLKVKWKSKTPLQLPKKLEIVGFSLVETKTSECVSNTVTGEYSCLELGFQFQRETLYYLHHIYLPSAVLVVLPWGTFLLDRRAVLVRYVVVLASVYGISSIAAEVEAAVAQFNSIKASDIWLGACYLFLLTTLVVFTIASSDYHPARASRYQEVDAVARNRLVQLEIEHGKHFSSEGGNSKASTHESIYHKILLKLNKDPETLDHLASRLLPTTFIVFCILYTCVYAF